MCRRIILVALCWVHSLSACRSTGSSSSLQNGVPQAPMALNLYRFDPFGYEVHYGHRLIVDVPAQRGQQTCMMRYSRFVKIIRTADSMDVCAPNLDAAKAEVDKRLPWFQMDLRVDTPPVVIGLDHLMSGIAPIFELDPYQRVEDRPVDSRNPVMWENYTTDCPFGFDKDAMRNAITGEHSEAREFYFRPSPVVAELSGVVTGPCSR